MVQQSLGHRRVIDHAERRSPAAALHALRYLLQDTVAQVVVDFHLGIAGKLERERLEVRIILSRENQRQAAADDIIQIHQETLPVFVRQANEAAADADRQLKESIFRHFPFAVFLIHPDSEVNILVVFDAQLFDSRIPDRNDAAIKILNIEGTDEAALLVVQLRIFQQIDILIAQFRRNLCAHLLKFLRIERV